MASKEHCKFSKAKQDVALNNSNDLYSNFTLNKSHKCITPAFDQKPSKSVQIGKSPNYGAVGKGSSQKDSSISLKKSHKNLSKDYFDTELNDAKKELKTEKGPNKMKNASTLSVHIAAYENFVEAQDSFDGKELKKKVTKITATKNLEQQFASSLFNDELEFPRQQEDEPPAPEIQQFAASQRLFAPNQEPPILAQQAVPQIHENMDNRDEDIDHDLHLDEDDDHHNMAFDDDYDVDDDENELDSTTSDGFAEVNVNTDRLPLVPSEFSTLDEALQNFVAVFESRYGPLHPFCYLSTLQESLTEAFDAPGRDVNERKPVAIYLHNDNSVACNIFAQQVMCSDTISPLLKGQFITWGWDVTYPENRTRFLDWLQMLNLNDVVHAVGHIRPQNYPILMVLIKDRGHVQPVVYASGHDSPDTVLEKLMQGLDMFVAIKNRAIGEERARVEREDLRAKQVAEYEESKAVDKAKQEERERVAREEREAAEAQERAEQEERARQEKLKATLPSEPAATDKDIITIRLRFPTGDQQIRRFRMNESVKWLVAYCESLGYNMQTYRLFTSDVPKKDVATLDNNKSFRELKWPPREQITIDEK